MTFYASLAGLLLALVGLGEGSLRTLPHLSLRAWLALVYLGVLGSGFSYVWYANGVMRLGAARAAAFINLVPISAVAFGAALLGGDRGDGDRRRRAGAGRSRTDQSEEDGQMSQKTVLIAGASRELGLEFARQYSIAS